MQDPMDQPVHHEFREGEPVRYVYREADIVEQPVTETLKGSQGWFGWIWSSVQPWLRSVVESQLWSALLYLLPLLLLSAVAYQLFKVFQNRKETRRPEKRPTNVAVVNKKSDADVNKNWDAGLKGHGETDLGRGHADTGVHRGPDSPGTKRTEIVNKKVD
jgi:hypothetical protein